jgi:hypothetical protein
MLRVVSKAAIWHHFSTLFMYVEITLFCLVVMGMGGWEASVGEKKTQSRKQPRSNEPVHVIP